MHKSTLFAAALITCSALTACGDLNGLEATPDSRSNLAMATHISRSVISADIAYVKYEVFACDDPAAPVAEAVVPLVEGQFLPNGFDRLKDSPLDEKSRHRFADYFQTLIAGCYDVVATPLDGGQGPSKSCLPAREDDIIIPEGETAETLLILQCQTPDLSALDAIAVVNHEPQITDITFREVIKDGGLGPGSKFQCGRRNLFCLEVTDPDNDPIKMEFEVSMDGDASACSIEDFAQWAPPSKQEKCFVIKCNRGGRADITATVFDQLHAEEVGLITFEEYFELKGDIKQSRAQLKFMTYLSDEDDCDKDPCGDDLP